MVTAVFSRVGTRLRAVNMDLDALRAELAHRYGVTADPRALAALAADTRMQRPDLELLVAIARVFAVSVDDLLDVRDISLPSGVAASDTEAATQEARHDAGSNPDLEEDVLLDPVREDRLRVLQRRRDSNETPLTNAEAAELDDLLDMAARALFAHNVEAYAMEQGISWTVAREDILATSNDAVAFADALQRDPRLMADEVAAIRAARLNRAG